MTFPAQEVLLARSPWKPANRTERLQLRCSFLSLSIATKLHCLQQQDSRQFWGQGKQSKRRESLYCFLGGITGHSVKPPSEHHTRPGALSLLSKASVCSGGWFMQGLTTGQGAGKRWPWSAQSWIAQLHQPSETQGTSQKGYLGDRSEFYEMSPGYDVAVAPVTMFTAPVPPAQGWSLSTSPLMGEGLIRHPSSRATCTRLTCKHSTFDEGWSHKISPILRSHR